ncbi:MAG: PDZ domain-containing protein [Oscillospiraceae bacterium]|nr:PDZ domain-containing protein [Oscillospiraceae bacterium]
MKTKNLLQKIVCAALLLTILVTFASAHTLIPGGNTIGMRAETAGLLVTAVERDSPASRAGLREGDLLLEANGETLDRVQTLQTLLASGEPISLTVQRGDGTRDVTLTPQRDGETYRVGAFVRDSVAGIGTVTYYDPQTGAFGALGHGVASPDGETLLPITGGVVVPSDVVSVVKSVAGAAGQLQGEFDADTALGDIRANTANGVFGTMQPPDAPAVETASADEVRPGAAVILANLHGTEVRPYDVEIVRCYDAGGGRDLLLRVTDETLLGETGGIVQGMSGSPILQDGKLVGAVTHVLVNQPDMGYGIYVENMLAASDAA